MFKTKVKEKALSMHVPARVKYDILHSSAYAVMVTF